MRLTTVDRMTFCADGSIEVRLLKKIMDGEVLLFSEPHRFVVQPDETIDAIFAGILPSLEQLGFPAVTNDEIDHAQNLITLHRLLPSVASAVEIYKQERAAAIAKQEKQAEINAAAEKTKRQTDEASIRRMIADGVAAAMSKSANNKG